ncbi:GDSL esterase/lipase At4g10955-like [Durio zibethinus]|uniref:GDSL esterase/lipase At4g10955-like n=1 Tax=Durio zibethinus TaxID=66656 RepID=A0A6P5WV75_DURZI|nr:GDSL esterase/lipase At4g10955-like [Durio zibethinus]
MDPMPICESERPICAEYIGYFEHRRKLENIGAGAIARLTSQHSLANLFMSSVGIKGVETSEPLHLLPSANLTVNLNPPPDIMQAHGLYQWWRPDLNLSGLRKHRLHCLLRVINCMMPADYLRNNTIGFTSRL